MENMVVDRYCSVLKASPLTQKLELGLMTLWGSADVSTTLRLPAAIYSQHVPKIWEALRVRAKTSFNGYLHTSLVFSLLYLFFFPNWITSV